MPISKRSRRSFRGRRQRRPHKSFAKRVLAVVDRQRELKVSKPMSTQVFVTPQINIANGSCVSIMPPIVQGDAESQRSGNQITLKKIVINAYYSMQFPIAGNEDTRALIRHMIVKQKNSNSGNVINGVTPLQDQKILENASPYNGGITDYNTPINRNSFTVRKQTKRVMSCPNSQGPVNQNSGSIDKSYWMVTYTMTFGKGKKLNYSAGAANLTSDFDYFLMHSASPMMEPAFVGGVSPVFYTQTATAYYFDS